MITYVSLAVRQYGEGRICISTDQISGNLTGHGANPYYFWRNILEWTAQRSSQETIDVGLVELNDSCTNRLEEFDPINVTNISTQDISRVNTSNFHILIFAGLPELSNIQLSASIEEYIRNGGGLLIVNPGRTGNINILSEIENINVSSINNPLNILTYWTEVGLSHYTYVPYTKSSLMSAIELSAFSSNWSILISSAVEKDEIASNTVTVTYDTDAFIGAEFAICYLAYMKDGIVVIEEEPNIGSTSSSSSMDSSSSSSSSSTYEDKHWDFCSNIVAYWKMNEDYNNSIVWDSSGNLKLLGRLTSGSSWANTSDKHTTGIINGAFLLDGVDDYIKTSNSQDLNFVNGTSDTAFSVVVWIKPTNVTDSYLILKKETWELVISDSKLYLTLFDNGGVFTRNVSSVDAIIVEDVWQNLCVTYDGTAGGFTMYKNGAEILSHSYDIGTYTYMNNPNDVTYVGASTIGEYFDGIVDNFIVVDKVLESYEVEGIYNRGNGTEECEGDYKYTSSSSSSTTSSSSYDSSSSTSLSSLSSSSYGFSESSSSSSAQYSESSSFDYSESSSSFGTSSSSSIDSSSSTSEWISSSTSSENYTTSSSSSSENYTTSSSSSSGYQCFVEYVESGIVETTDGSGINLFTNVRINDIDSFWAEACVLYGKAVFALGTEYDTLTTYIYNNSSRTEEYLIANGIAFVYGTETIPIYFPIRSNLPSHPGTVGYGYIGTDVTVLADGFERDFTIG